MNNMNTLVLCHWHDWHGKGFFCFQCLNHWTGQCGRNNCMLHNKFLLIGWCFQRNSDLSSPFLRFEWSNWTSKIQICPFLPCSRRKHIVKCIMNELIVLRKGMTELLMFNSVDIDRHLYGLTKGTVMLHKLLAIQHYFCHLCLLSYIIWEKPENAFPKIPFQYVPQIGADWKI